MRSIFVQGVEYQVEVILKRRNKKIYLRVKEQHIVITTPTNLSDKYIQTFIQKNQKYIDTLLNKPPSAINELHFFGKLYSLEIISSTYNDVKVEEERILIYAKKKENSYIQKIVTLFYTRELAKFVENNFLIIKNKFHIDSEFIIKYKNVKSYFGEYFPKRKIIIFSTRLAKYEPIYILSVIYHEVAHYFYQNHSMQFYALLEQVFPNYRDIHKKLKKIRYNDEF